MSSSVLKKAFCAGLLAVATAAGMAQAADGQSPDNSVTALVTTRSNTGDMASMVVPRLVDIEQCLSVAWLVSQSANGWRAKESTVLCEQGGKIVAAQACVNGECSSLTAPTMAPAQ